MSERGRENPPIAELLSNEAREEAIASSNIPYRKILKSKFSRGKNEAEEENEVLFDYRGRLKR